MIVATSRIAQFILALIIKNCKNIAKLFEPYTVYSLCNIGYTKRFFMLHNKSIGDFFSKIERFTIQNG